MFDLNPPPTTKKEKSEDFVGLWLRVMELSLLGKGLLLPFRFSFIFTQFQPASFRNVPSGSSSLLFLDLWGQKEKNGEVVSGIPFTIENIIPISKEMVVGEGEREIEKGKREKGWFVLFKENNGDEVRKSFFFFFFFFFFLL